ncbi:tRNA (adenosine(37)-N6)-dimethylallyltransferase MiaA [Craurococcus roseus]|uniref:tRNA dimethylallyltransferase n=1 Tax=Craurococcus roseus TaxID=77585 RepID=A0ABP3QEK1_9PROT
MKQRGAQPPTPPPALIVAGPTASGKSALALALARRLNGVVINADSMQVYRELRVLTARPTPDEEALAPHRLYGVRPAAEPADAAWWREQALLAMDDAFRAGKLPILCGGTGLYFLSLTRGLADVPAVPAWAREEARAQLAASGAPALHERLARLDPATAATLRSTDGQRLARALEVVLGTGRGLAAWRSGSGDGGAAPWRRWAVLLRPPRDELRQVVAARFDAMLRNGALDEVRAMLDQGLDPALPAMRAHGAPELAAHLAGRLGLPQAREKTIANTRRYVKRQDTWFRHHPLAEPDRVRHVDARFGVDEQFSERFLGEFLAFVERGR